MTGSLPDRLAGDHLAVLWSRCWKAMARSGPDDWHAVTVRVPLASDEQRRAIAGLVGRQVRPGTAAVSIRLGDLEQVLRRAGDDWGLVAVVEAAGGLLPDRAGATRAQVAAIARARDDARSVAGAAAWVEPWLDDLGQGMLARLHNRGELGLVTTAARVLARLPADAVPLPALAAAVTGDTKALAGTTLEGLVLRALAVRFGELRPRAAAERRAVWEAAGVVPDDLASQVLVLGLPVVADGALGCWLVDAAARGWPFRVTLHQLVRSPLTVDVPEAVYVCENPAVLRATAERLGTDAAPLVCTEGRPSVACTRLLATLREAGCELRYHGDFDWPGLRIAATVLAETGTVPWRLTATDYHAGLELTGGRDRPALRGPAAHSPWDPALAAAMHDAGVVVHEEDVLEQLLEDLSLVPGRAEECRGASRERRGD